MGRPRWVHPRQRARRARARVFLESAPLDIGPGRFRELNTRGGEWGLPSPRWDTLGIRAPQTEKPQKPREAPLPMARIPRLPRRVSGPPGPRRIHRSARSCPVGVTANRNGDHSLIGKKTVRWRRLRGVRPGFRFSQAGRGASDLTPAKPSDLSHRVEAIRENPLTGSDPANLAGRFRELNTRGGEWGLPGPAKGYARDQGLSN